MRVYTLEEVNRIININGFESCLCKDEKNGVFSSGIDTIQVATPFESEYFGEFVGNSENDQYEFIFYIN